MYIELTIALELTHVPPYQLLGYDDMMVTLPCEPVEGEHGLKLQPWELYDRNNIIGLFLVYMTLMARKKLSWFKC